MKHIAVVGALVGVVAVVSGCWAFGPLTREGAEPSPVVQSYPGTSPWVAESVIILQLHSPAGAPLDPSMVSTQASVVAARLAALGVAATVSVIPDDRLRIELARSSDADAVKRVATAPGNLRFVGVPEAFNNAITSGGPLPSGMVAEPLFGAEGVADARVGTTASGLVAVDIDLQPAAGQAFDAYAAEHQFERFAIVLDGVVIEAPVLMATSFNSRAEISGGFDVQGALELVAILHGTLPVAAEVLTVCPATEECPGPSASPGTGG